MAKQLKLKLIVTANLEDLKEDEFRSKARSMIDTQVKNPTYVPGIIPSPANVKTESTTLDDLILHRGQLEAQLKANTGRIQDQIRKMKDIFVSQWATQIQNAPGMTESKVKGLGYGIKGKYNGKSLPEYDMSNSRPMIQRIDLRSHLKHTVFIRNNKLKGRKMPHDAKRLDLYMSIGPDEPLDYHNMKYLGAVSGGKFENYFTEGQVGQWVWYVAVYIGRKKETHPVHSRTEKAMVV